MNLTKTNEMAEALKNIFTLLFYLALAVFFAFAIWPRIKDFEIKKLTIGGVEMAAKEAAFKAVDSVSNKISVQAKDTGKIPLKMIEAAKIVDTTLNLNSNNWVYIGQIINGKLANTHFKITNLPKVNETITAADAVYKRKGLPIELKDGKWQLGDIRGVVKDEESVTVLDVHEVSDKNYWALVR